MIRRPILLATAALLALTACSDSSSSSSGSTEAPSTSSSAAPVATTTTDSTDDTTVEDSAVDTTVEDSAVDTTVEDSAVDTSDVNPDAPGIGTEFCVINDELSQQDEPFDGAPTPAEVEEYFTVYFPAQMERLGAVTPDELADDVQVLQDGIAGFTTLLEANGWDMTTTLNDPAMATILGAEEYATAGNNVDAYCGVD